MAIEVPSLHRISPELYDEMVARGMLDGEPVELVDGLLVRVSPQGPEHAALIRELTARFASRPELLSVQLPLAVPSGRPEPDIALVESHSSRHHPRTADLVVEVAVSSWNEAVAKLPGYAAAGVRVAWLVDVSGRAVTVHERPQESGYASSTVVRGDAVLTAPVEGIEPFTADELFAVLDR